MRNKRGSSMATSTIVLLIIGLIILVVLILGFSQGWKSIIPWIGNGNIDTIKNSCSVACSTNGAFAFCSKQINVNDGDNPKFDSTCQELSMNPSYRAYGIEPCPGLCN